jgi:branched-subunit amino acid aminotransferase/4-amino-4-deoxychorismate lyase
MGIAADEGLTLERRPLHLSEIGLASEALVTGTGSGPLPVRAIDGQILKPVPGPVTGRLTRAFSKYVGVDIVDQARSHVRERMVT